MTTASLSRHIFIRIPVESMIWLTSCKTYAFPPIYHLIKRFYLILNGLKRCLWKKEDFLKKLKKERELKETWAAQGKRATKNPAWIGVLQRRRPDLNRCIRVLQTHALPLGYCALFYIYYMLCLWKNDSNGNRPRVTAVKGRCLNRLTMEPRCFRLSGFFLLTWDYQRTDNLTKDILP